MGTLNVYAEVKNGDDTTVKNLLWSMSRQQGRLWRIARVPANYDTDFRFIFEGKYIKKIIYLEVFLFSFIII